LLCIGLVLSAACESEPPDPFIPLLEKHAGITTPGPDTSNKYALDPAVAAFGKKLYFDPYFSGKVVGADMLLRTMTTPTRAPLGTFVNVSCNTCHDVTKGGSDPTSDPPGNYVSFGAGAYDVNSQQSINSGFLTDLVYWNGRNDSLWAQIIAVVESHVSVNGSRMRVAWRIIDKYKDEYQQLFPEFPLPSIMDSVAAQQARLEADGTCKLVNNACPPECHTTYGPCLPRYPLEARPGFVEFGELAECTWGQGDDILQPYNDAWDCMPLAEQRAATRIYVNFAKAIAAYEFSLVSKDSVFDKWADAGFPVTGSAMTPAAIRGARLFVGKAACAECHSGPLFTDNLFHDIGVPQLGTYVPTTADCPANGWCDCASDDTSLPQNCLPIGARDGIRKLRANQFRRDSVWSDDEECQRHFSLHNQESYAEQHPTECDGRVKYYSMPLTDELRGQWRTPSLRDVALTPPYMHNGMYKTLREVIVHYNKGGLHDLGGESIGTIDSKIKVLNLTEQEIDDLVAFLESLTGHIDPAVVDPPSVPPASAF
jgi:cytochrome c peroxidase